MNIDTDKLLENCLRDGIRDGIKAKLGSSYNDNPIGKMVNSCVESHGDAVRKLLNESLASCFDDADFRKDIKEAVRHTLAKILVARFGGELEKQVNSLKSDPTTRARITIAIEDVLKSKGS
jgi:hypothetical protein